MSSFVNKRNSGRYAVLALLVSLISLITTIVVQYTVKRSHSPEIIVGNLQKTILKTEDESGKNLNDFRYNINKYKSDVQSETIRTSLNKLRKNGYTFQCTVGDSLVYWTDNTADLAEVRTTGANLSLQRLKNGWYLVESLRQGDSCFSSLYLVKSEFSFENEYLENSFQKNLNVPDGIKITIGSKKYGIYSRSDHLLFALDFSGYTPSFDSYAFLFVILLLITYTFLFIALRHAYELVGFLQRKPWLFTVFFTADIIIVRCIQAVTAFPSALTGSSLFSPLYYSSSFLLPSLGDYLLNSFILLFLSVFYWIKIKPGKKHVNISRTGRIAQSVLALIFMAGIFIIFCLCLDDIVFNSSFSLDLRDISTIGARSLTGILVVSLLSFSMLFLQRTAQRFIALEGSMERVFAVITVSVGVYAVCLIWWDIPMSLFLAGLFGLFAVYSIFHSKDDPESIMPPQIVLPLLWLSVVCTAVFNEAGNYKEKEGRKLLAVRLAAGKNPVTEHMFGKLERNLVNDTVLWNYAGNNDALSEENAIKLIQSRHLKDFWNRFTVQITICRPGKLLKVQPRGYMFDCNQYFTQLCEKVGEQTSNGNLWYLDYGTGLETYLAVIRPQDSSSFKGAGSIRIYFELTAKSPAKDPGYPELLIDRKAMAHPDLSNYSYALYQENSLVYKAGKFSYPMKMNWWPAQGSNIDFINQGGDNHYFYHAGKSRTLVVSRKEDSVPALISPVSYLFIGFVLLALILNLALQPSKVFAFSFYSLKYRFRIANVSMIVTSFLILGGLLLYFLIRFNNMKNMDSFGERTLSVMMEMQQQYGDRDNAGLQGRQELEETLQRLSSMFYTDVNIYSPDGKLFLSSRPQVFEEGLISTMMNSVALSQLRVNSQAMLFQEESIGKYRYTSAYFPLISERHGLIAYVNLPFFSKQEDLKREINDFLVAFMNLYIIFILISVFVSIAISRYLSAPLAILAGRMEAFKLGKRNEKISWKHHDEIGKLVGEYNRLIDELAYSAEQLAVSERETAWREMARQVAHEIKNPLTPMKLSVQHLRKAWDEHTDDFDSRVKKFTRVLTEQIDALSAIATEFSDFAKMPSPVPESIDLVELIKSIVYMYEGQENLAIDFESTESEARVSGDRQLLARVFTNLLNNSLQALGQAENGIISIRLKKEETRYLISIKDNGNGIPAELNGKIFQPDFTTKTGGTGLGLAIVRGIIRNMGGDVTFVSENGYTIFTVIIPIHNQNSNAGKVF